MVIEFLGSPNRTYQTRGATYVASANGIILLNLAVGTNQDFHDLINAGCFPNFSTSGVLLGRLLGANMNSASADQAWAMTNQAMLVPYRITKITTKNASISLTTAAGGIYPTASQGGTPVVAAGQAYSGLTAATLALDLTIATTPGKTLYTPGQGWFTNLTTAQGAAATADFYMWGDLYD